VSDRRLCLNITELPFLRFLDFTSQIRLQQAKLPEEKNVYNIIAKGSSTVGFDNPAYLSMLFKKIIGRTPQELFKSAMQPALRPD